MLGKFDWQHYALLALSAVTILGPGVAQVLGLWQMPDAASLVTHLIGFATSILMLLKQYHDDPIFVQHGKPINGEKP
jgi:hypothetical protein